MTVEAPVQLTRLAQRMFNTPLAISRSKLDVLLAVLAPKWNLEAPQAAVATASVEIKAGIGSRRDRRPFEVTADGVAILPVSGTLVRKTSGLRAFSGLSSYETISAHLDQALEDNGVRAILLDVDSPGGEVQGMFDMADRIHAARGRKPIWAVANEDCFSAAYALASGADKIYVPRTGGVGSIGIVALHLDVSQSDAKAGRSYTYLFAGDRKVDGNPHQPLTDGAKATFQAEIDRVYGMFVATVARNRAVSEQAVRDTEAALFMGQAAISSGMADQIGGFNQAMSDLVAEIGGGTGSATFQAGIKRMKNKAQDEGKTDETEDEADETEDEDEVTTDDQEADPEAQEDEEEDDMEAKKQIAELTAKVAELEADKKAREAERAAAYVSDMVRQAGKTFQSPIPDADVDKVRQRLAAGDWETAKTLSEAYLTRSEAVGASSFRKGTTIDLAPTSNDDKQVDEDLKRRQKRLGMKVAG